MDNHNVQIFEPGHMETQDQYDSVAKKLSELYENWNFEKNMIYDLQQDRYIGF